jgi:monoamine oxidase
MDDLYDVDVIVVGCGFAGLIAARGCAEKGLSVRIVESKDRLGGRSWSVNAKDVFSKYIPNIPDNHLLDMGGEWIDNEEHIKFIDEMKRYNLKFEDETLNSKFLFNFCGGKKLSIDEPVPFTDLKEFNRVISIIDGDMRRLKFKQGFDQDEYKYFDIPFSQYINERLNTIGPTKEFLLASGFSLSGADEDQYSAMSILRNLLGLAGIFGNAKTAFLKTLSRLEGGTYTLAEKISEECISLGVEILYNKVVVHINSVQPTEIEDLNIPQYRRKVKSQQMVHIISSTGELMRSRGCICAVPMNILYSLEFSPPLPFEITQSSNRCNVGYCTKSWVLAEGVSPVDKVSSWPGCSESYVKYRYKDDCNKERCIICCFGTQAKLFGDNFYLLKHEELCERLEKKLKSHHPTIRVLDIFTHDYSKDNSFRGTWLALRAGTGVLYTDACRKCVNPWKLRGLDSLSIAGSDYSIGWSGWIEGAIETGYQSAFQINKYLVPPPKFMNFAKINSHNEIFPNDDDNNNNVLEKK